MGMFLIGTNVSVLFASLCLYKI